jgi:hypothetical protein
MTRRVGAPGALAEQRGRGKRKGRCATPSKERNGPQSALVSRGSSNGRTPRLTPEEMSVRIRRPEPENQVGPAPLERRRSPITNPGLDPRKMTVLANIKQLELLFQRSGSVHSTDWTRHEHPPPRQAN